MGCDPLLDKEGQVVGILCSRSRHPGSRTRCECCGTMGARFLCDFPMGKKRNGKPKTCDKKICGGCRISVGVDRDLCPEHAQEAPNLEFIGGHDV